MPQIAVSHDVGVNSSGGPSRRVVRPRRGTKRFLDIPRAYLANEIPGPEKRRREKISAGSQAGSREDAPRLRKRYRGIARRFVLEDFAGNLGLARLSLSLP